MHSKETLLFEETNFKKYFKRDLFIEKSLLEYDGIPLLCVCIDDSGQRYFCNCTEFRSYERWIIYPVSLPQLIEMINNDATPDNVLSNSTSNVYVYTIDWENEKDKLEEVSASDLAEYDKLPVGEYLGTRPNQFLEYSRYLNSIYAKPEKVQYKKVADTRIMHNMEMDWNALSEFNHLFAKVKSKSQIAITLKLFFDENHKDIEKTDIYGIGITHLTEYVYGCV
jgi:hypothetical protein